MHIQPQMLVTLNIGKFSQQCLFVFSLSPPAECRGLQYEHPHARSPSEFLSGHSFPVPEGCRAAGETHFRTWCGLLTNGYEGEPLATYSDSCQQEEGRKKIVQYVQWTEQLHCHWPAWSGSEMLMLHFSYFLCKQWIKRTCAMWK